MLTLLATECCLHSKKRQKKNTFRAYIYIRFNQNFDEKSYISATIEFSETFTGSFLLISEERKRPNIL